MIYVLEIIEFWTFVKLSCYYPNHLNYDNYDKKQNQGHLNDLFLIGENFLVEIIGWLFAFSDF